MNEEPPKPRPRRSTIKPEPKAEREEVAAGAGTKLPDEGPWCRHCGHEHGDEPGGRNPIARVNACTAAAFGTDYPCEGCGAVGVPVFDKAAVLPPRQYDPPPKLPDVQRIVESVFQVDLGGDWDQLNKALVVGDQRGDLGTVRRALDHAEDNARKAHKLYCRMRAELERYRIRSEVLLAAMRTEATDLLQEEKARGERNKAITEDDVKSKMAELHPREYERLRLDAKEFELAVDHAEELNLDWKSRCQSLRTMVHSIRGAGVSD